MPTGVAMAATHLGNGDVPLPLRTGDLSSGKISDEEADVELGQAPDVTVSPIPRSSVEIACEPRHRVSLTRLVHTGKAAARQGGRRRPIDDR